MSAAKRKHLPEPAGEGRFAYEGLERAIHEKARLGIMTSLSTQPQGLLFVDLKRLCSLTDGNLNRHLKVLEEEGLVERAAVSGRHAMDRMHDLMNRSPIIGDVRGRGLLFGVEIVADKQTRAPGNDLAEKIYYRCLDEGLSFKISQGCVLTLSPPLTIARDDLDRALDIVEHSVLAF